MIRDYEVSMIRRNHDVYVISYGINEFPVGRIKQDTLFLDNPSRHRHTMSYGIDREVLTSDEMDFQYIIIRERGKDWTTSRSFWKDYGKIQDLNNGRVELFLADEWYGEEITILYKKILENKWLQFDIFDLAHHSGSWDGFYKVLPYWEKENFEICLQISGMM